jgi:hypothetical protein
MGTPVPRKLALVVPYREVSAALARARVIAPLSRHASWFVPMRQGRMELVVADIGIGTEQVYPLRVKEGY